MQDNRPAFIRFNNRSEKLAEQYNEQYYERQHAKGKLTARERIDILFDSDSFEELDAFVRPRGMENTPGAYGDGLICGHGRINGRKAFAYAQDFNFMGGSLGSAHAAKIMKVQDMARKMGHPIIGLIDSGGARIQEGIASLNGYGGIFLRNIQSSGIIPQISVILGPAAGGATYSPALTDFIFMTRHIAQMFVTGPNVVKEVLNEDITAEQLGGADIHSTKTGVSQFVYDDEELHYLGFGSCSNTCLRTILNWLQWAPTRLLNPQNPNTYG
jgi:propionyl-CoA carboxylase beta chain